MTTKPHIVIIGSGFGGVYTAKNLIRELGDDVDITIVSRDNYFLFTPLLHEVATGSLSHQSVVEPVVEIFRGTHLHFCQGKVSRIDLENKLVEGDNCSFQYDYLVISSGAETNMYGIEGVKENAMMLKNLSDAVNLRRRIIDLVKKASRSTNPDERKKLLSFLVVGGGPTGVELVSELEEFVSQLANSYYAKALSEHEISITLIASSPDLVPQFSPKVRAKALSVLARKGVEVLLGTLVSRVSTDGVDTKDISKTGSPQTRFIPAGTIIWVAGVEASLPEIKGEAHIHKSGRLMANEFLQVEGHTNVFALGDGAILPIKEGEHPVPQLAQVAEQEAKIAAKNISRLIKARRDCTPDSGLKNISDNMSACSPNAKTQFLLFPFIYKSKGMLISLGSWQASGDIFGLHPSGPLMWFIWRTIYLFKFNSWRKRLSILVEWTINLFTPRDISEI